VSRRGTTTGTIFWGLTLIAIGALLLARNFGYGIPIWGVLVRYWPVLIIVWGLLKLVDFYRMRNDPDRRPVFSGGEIVMLILVLFAGSAITAAANISPEFGRFFDFTTDFDFWDITGSTYRYTEHHELAAKPGATIRIFNLYGSVDVKPVAGDQIILDVDKSVRAASQTEADERAKDFTFSIQDQSGTYRILSNRDESVFGGGDIRVGIHIGNERQRYKSNLTIQVPKKAQLDLTNKYGAVAVTGLEDNESISNKFGITSLHDITGSVTVTTGYGSVVLENVSGDANVTNGYASTTLRNIGGKVNVENKYGSVDVQDVKANAFVQNRFSVVNAQRIAGNLTVQGRNNSVDIDDVGGSVDVETSYKNLTVRNAKGAMRVANRHGGVDIEFEQSPKNDIRVNSEYSSVTIEIPAGSGFMLDAQTRFGEIDSEFDSATAAYAGRTQNLHTQQGSGGPRIVIETTHGNIRVQKRG